MNFDVNQDDVKNGSKEGTELSGLIKCFLAEDSARITNSFFYVYIPTLMGDISPSLNETEGVIDTSMVLSDIKVPETKLKTKGSIKAMSIHPYTAYQHGWIPTSKTEKIEATSITIAGAVIASGTMSGISTDCAYSGNPHPALSGAISGDLAGQATVINTMDNTNITEFGYHELNRIYIKRGHTMYGMFVSGEQNEFKIMFIDNVTHYYNEAVDNNVNDMTNVNTV